MRRILGIMGMPLFMMLAGLTTGASAATFTVTNTNDSGAGSLRQAVLDANAAAGDDIIAFDSSFDVPRTITLASLITVTGSGGLTLNGPGANLLTISGNNTVRVFELSGLNAPTIGAIVFNNLTIADAGCTASGCGGGGAVGINNGGTGTYTAVTFTANNVLFLNNNAGVNEGGAIFCTRVGTVNVNNSIFTRGIANGGSGIDIGNGVGSCHLNVNNSSFYKNSLTAGDNVIKCCGNGNGNVTINNSAFYDNGNNATTSTIRFGAGENTGNVAVINTTIANNRGIGAALFWAVNNATVLLTLKNVTIAGNFSSSSNVAAGFESGNINVVQIGDSIIANNFNPAGPRDVVIGPNTTFNSQGYNLLETVTGAMSGSTTGNLIGVDPWLDGTMRDNGAPTKTLALRPGSPAIDAGNPTTFPTTDQRGISRPQDGDGTGGARSDIGAFERRPIDVVQTGLADFDGDGKIDLSIFRPGPGEWWHSRSSDGGNAAYQFGAASDILTPADYTGDGKTDVAVFRPSTGTWFVLRSEDLSFFSIPFGTNGDVPAPSDFDGDGKADATVFRPSSNTWFINRSTGGTTITGFGSAGDVPVPADYDGDGLADIAIYRPSVGQWWIQRSNAGLIAYAFGTSGDRTVQGDFTGDGKADSAFFRPSTNQWFVLRSEDFSFYAFPFGSAGDIPSPGDYDGDGRFDAAVFRPSTSTWFVQRSNAGTLIQTFGALSDIPVPSVYVRQ